MNTLDILSHHDELVDRVQQLRSDAGEPYHGADQILWAALTDGLNDEIRRLEQQRAWQGAMSRRQAA